MKFSDSSIRSGDIGCKEANNMSITEERILRSVTLEKDESGSLGIQVTEGSDGAVYIQAVVPGGAADKQGVVKRGAYMCWAIFMPAPRRNKCFSWKFHISNKCLGMFCLQTSPLWPQRCRGLLHQLLAVEFWNMQKLMLLVQQPNRQIIYKVMKTSSRGIYRSK